MTDKKYILDVDNDLPRFPWYNRRYRKANRLMIDTSGWARIGPEEEGEKKTEVKHERTLKQVASRIRLSQKLSSGLDANLKGKVLVKCELPKEVQNKVNRVLGWSIDTQETESSQGLNGDSVEIIDPEEREMHGSKELEKETKSTDGRKDPTIKRDNPYMVFLDAVAGEEDEEDESKGVAGGLKSWFGFAGSLSKTDSTPSAGTDQQKPPWLKGENTGDDTMTKKAEENMTKIAGEFCNWLKDLPGEDKSVNQISDTHLRSLFDTAQSANPGTTKLADGLRSWAKFGSAVTGDTVTVHVTGAEGSPHSQSQANKIKFAEKVLGSSGQPKQIGKSKEVSKYEKMLYYGAWYLDPKEWESRYHRQIETQGGTNIEDKTKGKLQACLPGQVDLMGIQQPISQLHSTKAFGAYLNQKKNYKKPKFIKYIMASNEV